MTILRTGQTKRNGPGLPDGTFAVLLVLPGLALFAAIILYPLLASLTTGFFRQDLRFPGREFVGLSNFADVLHRDFWPTLEHTLVFAGGTTAAAFGIGFALALALNAGLRGSGFMRGLFLFPWVIPGVVTSFLWMWIFNANYGLLNGVLIQLGLMDEAVSWLGEPGTAMLAVIVTKTWASFPWMMVMMLAGLQTVPGELYEAAAVDGAGMFRRFRSITWPGVRSIGLLALLLEFIWNFQHFDTIYVLTGGGPANSTQTFAVAVFQDAFQGFDLGRASALGGLWMLLLLALVGGYLFLSHREDRS
ncbi:carbohydrate ABC transporter permease [Streptomyces sp. NPDC090303]|uniref:carbohydrate ABC transporter permease n=1 Tax=Streptomyces sp. NPDC090303 TaxID=3365960 RepID=UPI0038284910